MYVKQPPMGWNTWNTFGPEISDRMIRESADAMIDQGLRDAGYEYVVIDDCWSKRERDPETGKLVADPEKFPNGMKSVADYIHEKGLKFGMYSCCGVRTCANYPGSFDHEFLDAETFAEFGCDFLKYDNCFRPASANSPLLYQRMGTALSMCGRDILYSACNWGSDDVWSWIRSAGAHMYRSTGDILDNFKSFTDIAASQYDKKLAASAPNCFNDMDMLTVGMFGNGNVGTSGCTEEEYRTQFALWCMASTPLMLGCDIRKMTKETKDIVTNRALIEINQDPDCRPPFLLNNQGERKTYAKRLANGDFAILFLNFSDKERNGYAYFEEMGVTAASGYRVQMTDLFTGEEREPAREFTTVSVPEHGCRIYRAKLVR